MKLTQLEKESAVWKKIEAAARKRLEVLREKNDGAWDPIETATMRGAIQEVKLLLGWGKPNPHTFEGD